MSGQIIRRLKPEEEEILRKREELTAIRATLAERELELVDLRSQLAAFEGRYLRQVGTLYAELDEWKARISELHARRGRTKSAPKLNTVKVVQKIFRSKLQVYAPVCDCGQPPRSQAPILFELLSIRRHRAPRIAIRRSELALGTQKKHRQKLGKTLSTVPLCQSRSRNQTCPTRPERVRNPRSFLKSAPLSGRPRLSPTDRPFSRN